MIRFIKGCRTKDNSSVGDDQGPRSHLFDMSLEKRKKETRVVPNFVLPGSKPHHTVTLPWSWLGFPCSRRSPGRDYSTCAERILPFKETCPRLYGLTARFLHATTPPKM